MKNNVVIWFILLFIAATALVFFWSELMNDLDRAKSKRSFCLSRSFTTSQYDYCMK